MKLDRIVCWTGTVITIIGAALISINLYPIGPIVAEIGSFIFIIWALMIHDRAMIAVNVSLFTIYGAGMLLKLGLI